MLHTMFVDNLSRSSHSESVAGRGIAMQEAGHKNSDAWCMHCRGVGRRLNHPEGKKEAAWAQTTGEARLTSTQSADVLP